MILSNRSVSKTAKDVLLDSKVKSLEITLEPLDSTLNLMTQSLGQVHLKEATLSQNLRSSFQDTKKAMVIKQMIHQVSMSDTSNKCEYYN
jgi:hypothetical protein